VVLPSQPEEPRCESAGALAFCGNHPASLLYYPCGTVCSEAKRWLES